jgi:hypothetical protein
MNYKEAVNGPDGMHWRAEIETKYQKMLINKVFEVVLQKDLPSGTKLINSICSMNNKSNGILCG